MHGMADSAQVRQFEQCQGRTQSQTNPTAAQSCASGGEEHESSPVGVRGDDFGAARWMKVPRLGDIDLKLSLPQRHGANFSTPI